jgi:hypothetical protein
MMTWKQKDLYLNRKTTKREELYNKKRFWEGKHRQINTEAIWEDHMLLTWEKEREWEREGGS